MTIALHSNHYGACIRNATVGRGETLIMNRILRALVAQKANYIGGKLEDYGDPMYRRFVEKGIIDGPFPMKTTITDITFEKNYFMVVGEDFQCGGSLEYLHITHNPEFEVGTGIAFRGYGGHEWHIHPKENHQCRRLSLRTETGLYAK